MFVLGVVNTEVGHSFREKQCLESVLFFSRRKAGDKEKMLIKCHF